MRSYREFFWAFRNLHFRFGGYGNPTWFGKRRVGFSKSEIYPWEGTCTNGSDRFEATHHSWYLVLWWFTLFLELSVYRPCRIDGVPR